MLRVGTILRGVYRIDSYLASGGFGKTYVATNIEFNERVAVKEFFIMDIAQRKPNTSVISVTNGENLELFEEQKEKFKKEARRMRQFNNPHIVRVHDLFEENGTAYYVMDYIDGENLAERLKRTARPMTESEVRLILPQILDSLKAVHDAGIWHLDLKPSNIMLEKGGNIKLIDFGASKQLDPQKGGATTGTRISYTPGYAPREQMEQNYQKFGPWTDMYALGATLYNLLTNKCPPLPSDIDDDDTEDKHIALPTPHPVSIEMRNLIIWMMMTNYKERPKSVISVRKLIEKGNTSFSATNDKRVQVSPQIVKTAKVSPSIPKATADSQVTHRAPETLIVKTGKVPPSIPKANADSHITRRAPETHKVNMVSPLYDVPPKKSSSSNGFDIFIKAIIITILICFLGGVVFFLFPVVSDYMNNSNTNSQTENHENIESLDYLPHDVSQENEIKQNQETRQESFDWTGNYVAVKDAGNTYGGTPIFFEVSFNLKATNDGKYKGTMEISGYQTYFGKARIEGNVYGNRIRINYVSSRGDETDEWSSICDGSTPLLSMVYSNGRIDAEWFAVLCETEVVNQDTPVKKQ